MRKAVRTAIAALVCFALLFSSSLSRGVEIGTDVSVAVVVFEITSQTEDCTVDVGDELELQITASQEVVTYSWEVSADGGTGWTQVATSPTCTIANARPNTPADVPYQYRVTVTNDAGKTVSTIIRVLVADNYDYRTIALRNGDTDVSAYMHDETRLVVIPLPESSPAALELERQLASDKSALVLYDVKLVNQNDQVLPYFGALQVNFHVGEAYNGMTLRVFHLHNNNIITYSGVVSGGVLSITVNVLSPFMVEVPSINTHAVTASAGTGGGISPSGRINVTQGSSRTFTFLPDTGFAVDTVTVNGTAVTPVGNSYTIDNVQSNTAIVVTFRAVTPSSVVHTVAPSCGANGRIVPGVAVRVRHGEAQTFYFYPDSGYELDGLSVGGAQVNVLGNSYTLSAVEADTAVHATFRRTRPETQPPNVQKTITASADANGAISPSGAVSVEYGGGMYFYFIPDEGYETDVVRVDGTPVTTGNAYRFINVIADHTIHATFRALPEYYTVTATAGANGSISPGTTRIPKGGSQTFTFFPDSGYVVDTVTVDGTVLPSPGTSYSFTDVTDAHTISVTFKPGVTPPSPITCYAITVNAPPFGGTISPSGTIQVPEGGSQTFSFIPYVGYVLDTVTIDGVLQTSPRSSYTFTNVTGAHTVSATFRSISQQHTIVAAVSGAGGRISPEGSVLVPPGGAQTFYFIPDSGYTVREVWVDGVAQRSVAYQYTFTDVRADHTIQVSFARTATPPTGDTDNKLLWTFLIIASLLLAVFCLLYMRKRTKKPEQPDAAAVPEPQKDAQG